MPLHTARINFAPETPPKITDDGQVIYGFACCHFDGVPILPPLPVTEPMTDDVKDTYAQRILEQLKAGKTLIGRVTVVSDAMRISKRDKPSSALN